MVKAAIYARYSSVLQDERSIEDQIRLCRENIERDKGTVVDIYTDYAISGGSLRNRPGMQTLLADAKSGTFDVVFAEALDRISRDQEDIAAIYKRLSHADVRIVTLSEGEVNELHVGLKGTMNALFLAPEGIGTADLADQVSNLLGNPWSPGSTSRLQPPEGLEATPVPAQHGLGLDDDNRTQHTRPQPIEPDEQESVGAAKP